MEIELLPSTFGFAFALQRSRGRSVFVLRGAFFFAARRRVARAETPQWEGGRQGRPRRRKTRAKFETGDTNSRREFSPSNATS